MKKNLKLVIIQDKKLANALFLWFSLKHGYMPISIVKQASQKISKPKFKLSWPKIYYIGFSVLLVILLILSLVKIITLNSTDIFLLCLSGIVPLFPTIKKLKLFGIIELETSLHNKDTS